VLPAGLGAEVDLGAWALPAVFGWLAEAGGLAQAELLRTFNAGIGMVLVVEPARAAAQAELLEAEGARVFTIGRVIPTPGMHYTGSLK
jgi:phosphoribosylformylglycinamidine cyclo-ligase